MTEDQNIPEEDSQEQITNSNEEIANETISQQETIEQPETQNLKQETENMEVHKHPHHVTRKKKWGEYLLEFLMIFLAVTMGFFAEQIREGFVESRHEKEYMVS